MPSSASSGVRETPLPVVPGREAIPVRLTAASNFDGCPYSLIPAPGDFIHGGVSGGSKPAASRADAAATLVAPSTTTPCLRNCRRGTASCDRSGCAIPASSARHWAVIATASVTLLHLGTATTSLVGRAPDMGGRWTSERMFEYFPVRCKRW